MQATMKEVFAAISKERKYQNHKWGGTSNDSRHPEDEWFRFIHEELFEAGCERLLSWKYYRREGEAAQKHVAAMKAELVQAVATIVAMLQQIGVEDGH